MTPYYGGIHSFPRKVAVAFHSIKNGICFMPSVIQGIICSFTIRKQKRSKRTELPYPFWNEGVMDTNGVMR